MIGKVQSFFISGQLFVVPLLHYFVFRILPTPLITAPFSHSIIFEPARLDISSDREMAVLRVIPVWQECKDAIAQEHHTEPTLHLAPKFLPKLYLIKAGENHGNEAIPRLSCTYMPLAFYQRSR